jgi:hypothetical protein
VVSARLRWLRHAEGTQQQLVDLFVNRDQHSSRYQGTPWRSPFTHYAAARHSRPMNVEIPQVNGHVRRAAATLLLVVQSTPRGSNGFVP